MILIFYFLVKTKKKKKNQETFVQIWSMVSKIPKNVLDFIDTGYVKTFLDSLVLIRATMTASRSLTKVELVYLTVMIKCRDESFVFDTDSDIKAIKHQVFVDSDKSSRPIVRC